MTPNETQKILLAGKIAKQVREYAKTIVKKDKSLLEIAEQIENKIIELGAKPAFPTNLSINEIAAHYTPSYNDETKAQGLLKVDLGVHIDGYIADTAFSVDLENSNENKNLIKASEDALNNAIKLIKEKKGLEKISNNKLANKKSNKVDEQLNKVGLTNNKLGWASDFARENKLNNNERGRELGGVTTSQIGSIIQQTIESYKFSPIVNLSGHSMEKYDLHSGITIPNIDDEQFHDVASKNIVKLGAKRNIEIKDGLYAIEPFATNGSGKIHDANPSGIYIINQEKNTRSPLAREILNFIIKEYQTLPFCSRWIIKKFGARSLFALRELENNNIINQFNQLVEVSHKPVAQSEDTILIEKEKVEVTTN